MFTFGVNYKYNHLYLQCQVKRTPLHGFGYCAHHLKLKSVTLVANIRYITWLSVAYVTGELRILTREEAKKRRVKIWHLYEPKEDNKIELSIHMKITKNLLLNLKKNFWLKLKTTFFMIHFSIHFHALINWAFKTEIVRRWFVYLLMVSLPFSQALSVSVYLPYGKSYKTSRRLDIFRFRIVYTCFLFLTFPLQLPLTDARCCYMVHIFV